MQNRIFQNTCNQLKKDVHRKIGIMDDGGYIIACSDESKVGHQNEAVIAHFETNNDEYIGGGYVFRKIETCNKNIYVVFCEGTDELAKGYAAFLCTHFLAIKQYYDEKYEMGKQYSYIYPGMNRVFQAAGRVIRREDDRGVIVLIDDRFDDPIYKKSLPALWRGVKFVGDAKRIRELLDEFWQGTKD
jgi:hypothetical protein